MRKKGVNSVSINKIYTQSFFNFFKCQFGMEEDILAYSPSNVISKKYTRHRIYFKNRSMIWQGLKLQLFYVYLQNM